VIITGLVHDTAAEEAETGGINVNVWSGIGMVAVALAFLLRVVLRPVVSRKPNRLSPKRIHRTARRSSRRPGNEGQEARSSVPVPSQVAHMDLP
jgi:hypothetical protein